ncbi:XXYS1_4_G0055330.mRNA.1.CDS.1 [Saccharomyces cerevisiae]|nr:EM14S01-3B_G0052650.mRNA.1.CDS.1 [Saccharomyces cerevisiae]CAD6620967.1 XXYS1_4_G0055330.mRNA.1.CDS.1 [Saccharomyces cerevisiae]CAI4389268.1 AMH_1a_G0026550.mRNA.1.CDS.1 [Saccharomyces cerevisiae]CAI4398596.1 CEI_1a_G0026480.mRNA.1.CDS.1 [Saccharomyces cerevisiae]CAI6603119.1 AMH_1a_G0026550.mRNA.1.CDS.1 [Saccharomyces cerevisiae]
MNFSTVFEAIIAVLGFTTVTALAEFDFDVGYEEFVRNNPDTIFLESDIGLHVGYTEGGERQITTIPHNSTLGTSLREYSGCGGNGTETSIATPAPIMSEVPIATLVKRRKSVPILLPQVCMGGISCGSHDTCGNYRNCHFCVGRAVDFMTGQVLSTGHCV